MKSISHRRRQLIIAGIAGAATPASVFAGQCMGLVGDAATTDALASPRPIGTLIVSGRVVDADCRAIAGAVVEAGRDASATTDGDGRFVLSLTTPHRRAQPVRLRVSHGERRMLVQDFAPRARRDEAGTWRTTVGVTLA